ncbi:hypothetical protein HZS_6399, partial [Henneguya salminicola]
DLVDQGGELLSLRYDLTVPLARYVAINKIERIKRFHIAKVYRRDNPAMTRGRFREFYQCDFDICGHYDPIIPDVECCKVVCEILKKLNIGAFSAKINHRKILDGYMHICGVPDSMMRAISSSIDKMDKLPWQKIRQEMIDEKEISEEIADKIQNFVNLNGGLELIDQLINSEHSKNAIFLTGLTDMRIFFEYAKSLNIDQYLKFDLSLARGLDYYTGIIFEFISSPESDINVGSIAGGGRYDDLIGMFSKNNKKIPAVGISIGVERIMSLMEHKYSVILPKDGIELSKTNIKVLVSSVPPKLILNRLNVAQMLWDAEIPTEILYKVKGNMLRDFQYCEQHHIPFCVIIGEDEISNNCVTLRQICTREQMQIPLLDLVKEIKKLTL